MLVHDGPQLVGVHLKQSTGGERLDIMSGGPKQYVLKADKFVFQPETDDLPVSPSCELRLIQGAVYHISAADRRISFPGKVLVGGELP